MESKIIPPQGELIASTQEPASSTKTSPKKIEANRRNALRSTGPKTARGKRAVARNAMTHGLLTRETIIAHGEGAEDPQEFIQLLSLFYEEYKPVGISEELLVQRIGACYWRLARVLRFEAGETQKRLNGDAKVLALQEMAEVNSDISILEYQQLDGREAREKEPSREEWFKVKQRQQSSLLTHHIGIKYVRDVLVNTKAEIQEKGNLSLKSCRQLMSTSGLSNRSLGAACMALTENKAEMCDSTREDKTEQTKAAERKVAIDLLDERLELVEPLLDLAIKNIPVEIYARVKSLALPDEAATDKLLRYETHLERQLYRAMDQLERLQRRRKGENVPPPLNLNLGRRG